MLIVNFSNQVAAGPAMIARNFIDNIMLAEGDNRYIVLVPDIDVYSEYATTKTIRIIRVTRGMFPGHSLYNVFFVNLVLIPRLISEVGVVKGLLSFGNFSLVTNLVYKKVVLLHHPYIVDDRLFSKLNVGAKLSETIKRCLFRITLKRVDVVVVQSDYMLAMLKQKYTFDHDRVNCQVLHNPVSRQFEAVGTLMHDSKAKKIGGKFRCVYVSRFYPHKNHQFLLELARVIVEKRLEVEIVVTIDPSLPGAQEYLDEALRDNLPVINIGEVSQHALINVYQTAAFALFPSSSETFGNPLIEAMLFGLPVIAPDLPYSRSVLDFAGVFYPENSVLGCYSEVCSLLEIDSSYAYASKRALRRANDFPSSDVWFKEMLGLLGDEMK